MRLEKPCEMAHAAETKLFADEGDGRIGGAKFLFCFGQDFLGNKILGSAAHLLAHQLAEVVGRETQFAGTPGHRGLSFQQQLTA